MLNGGGGDAGPVLLVAAAALMDSAGRVLVQRVAAGRPHAGAWEFPGGKVEPGETPVAALAREVAEELGIVVDPNDAVPLGFAEERNERPLVLLLWEVRRWRGEPAALDAAEIRWVSPADLPVLAMPPPDVPLARALARRLEARAGIEPACKDLQSSA